jgi:hypothetical protein
MVVALALAIAVALLNEIVADDAAATAVGAATARGTLFDGDTYGESCILIVRFACAEGREHK